jgi:predicted small integral membrane protein
MDFSWMAWTQPTAMFFLAIASLVLAMCVWEVFSPGGNPRAGLLGITTTRGDRLFISLLGSAFICLAWLGLIDAALWWSLPVCVIYSVFVFRYC